MRPLDAIQPYRLEMGRRLKTSRGRSLYEFWGSEITQAVNKQMKKTKSPALVNLASEEYFGAIRRDELNVPVIDCVFLEERDGQQKIISFYAKKARGMMARYMIENRVQSLDALKQFQSAGYCFDAGQSEDARLVFVRASS